MPRYVKNPFRIARSVCHNGSVVVVDEALIVQDHDRRVECNYGRPVQIRSVGPFTMYLIEVVPGGDGMTAVIETREQSSEVAILAYSRGTKDRGDQNVGRAAATQYMAEAVEADLVADFDKSKRRIGGWNEGDTRIVDEGTRKN